MDLDFTRSVCGDLSKATKKPSKARSMLQKLSGAGMGCDSSKSALIEGELTAKEKQLIRKSWALFTEGNVVDNGIPMFLKIMENPKARSLFMFAKDEDVTSPEFRNNEQLRAHVTKVFETIEMVEKNLDNITTINPLLEALGDTHAYYHATKELFEPVGKAMLFAFEEKLKGKFTSDVRRAWAHLYSIIERAMTKGMDPK